MRTIHILFLSQILYLYVGYIVQLIFDVLHPDMFGENCFKRLLVREQSLTHQGRSDEQEKSMGRAITAIVSSFSLTQGPSALLFLMQQVDSIYGHPITSQYPLSVSDILFFLPTPKLKIKNSLSLSLSLYSSSSFSSS